MRNSMRRFVVFSLALSVALSMVLYGTFATGQTAPPATQPAGAAAPADVSPEAQAVLDAVDGAYAGLKTFQTSGTVNAQFDVAGEQLDQKAEFTSTYGSPNLFRHEMKEDIIVGSTGAKVYAYRPADNIYLMTDLELADGERIDVQSLPPVVGNVLGMQNPSLMLALSNEPSKRLTDGATSVKKQADETVDGATFTSLTVESPVGTSRILVDPQTHLVRRVVMDISSMIREQGADDVKKAELTFDYTATQAGADVEAAHFAWSPPENARDASQAAALAGGGAAEAMVGKPAPDFTLASMDGGEVKLSSLRGNVVVLDFWATWCGPCIVSMPHIAELHKELSPNGVKVYAVNIGEGKEQITGFLTTHKLEGLPVLLDSDQQVALAYNVEGIPMTVVIDTTGTVRNVNTGFAPGADQRLRQQIEAAGKAEAK